ncbi:MAG: hypothetical protein LLF76_02225 [Planctomycetaceae bacterium]|nr:hypothetical protein [Planctomycetaceae bacterium]
MHAKSSFTSVLFLAFITLSAFAPAATELVIDNGDPYTSFTGTWGVSGAAGAWGADSLWARGGTAYTWLPRQLDPGEYEVFMWWTQLSSRANAAPVEIVHSAGTTNLVVNQKINGGQWNSLGTYHFPGYLDGTGSVTITALGVYPISTCADAVRFVPVTPPTPDMVIDNTDTALTSRVGTWSVSGGENPYGTNSLYCRAPNCSFSWRFTAAETAYYNVSMWWTEFSSRSAAAPVEIETAYGQESLAVNQQTDGGQWNLLGEYLFEAGVTYDVTIRTLADNTTVCADAVAFEKTSTPIPGETITYADGLLHEISTLVNSGYIIKDGPSSQPTTLTVTPTGQIGTDTVNIGYISITEHSILNTYGNIVWGFNIENESKANIYEGASGLGFFAQHDSVIDMYGGNISAEEVGQGIYWIILHDNSKFNLHGGVVDGQIALYESAAFTMTGGQVDGLLQLTDFASAVIKGGSIDAVDCLYESIVEIYGPSFNLPFGEVTAESGTITGTLQNGDPLSVAFTRASTGKIILIDTSPAEVIIDNTDTALTSRVGTWPVSGGENPYGTDSLYCRAPNCSFSWHFTPTQSGNYYVFMWWTEFSSRSTDVPVEIETAGGTQYLTVNQRGDGGKWNLLGNDDYSFSAGTTYKITIRTLADNTTVCADAVRFAPADAEIVYADGLTHEIDSLVLYTYRVYDGPTEQPTTLNITESGQVGTYQPLSWNTVSVFEHSILNIWGRLSWGFDADDDSKVNMYSGYSYAFGVSGNSRLDIYGGEVITGLPWGMDFATMDGNSQVYVHDGSINTLSASGTSRFVMNGGTIREFEGGGGSGYIQAYGQSRIEINDGSVDGSIEAGGQSRVEISGGSVGHLSCVDDAQVQICGGSVRALGAYSTGTVTIKGGNVQNLTVGSEFDSAAATVEIYGSAFNLPFGEVTALSGTITGTLENGDPLDVAFTRDPTSKIVLIQSSTDDIIIDNGDPGTSFTGTWGISGATGAYGTDSLWARGGAAYTWQTSLPAGNYEVYMWWTQLSSRTSAAPVAVVHAGGTKNLTVNQRTNGGKWNSLGTYYFDGTGSVTITALGAYPVSTCADAVRFVKVVAPPQEIIIDNRDAATQRVGTWSVSGGADPYGADSVYCRDANRSFTWLFTPAQDGDYDVSMWWTEFSSRSAVTPVEIQHAAGTASMTVNQKINGGTWNTLGRYGFEAGLTYKITVRTLPDRSAVCADAVKFSMVVN